MIIIIFTTQNRKRILFRPNRPHIKCWVDFSLSQVRPRAVFSTAAIKTDPVAHRPRLCKCGGARMAHNAKDRVTNQEFASCHSWERRRGQKLGIKRFSSERNKRKAANFVAIFLSKLSHVSTFPDALRTLWGKKLFLFFMMSVDPSALHDDLFQSLWWNKLRTAGEPRLPRILWLASFGFMTFFFPFLSFSQLFVWDLLSLFTFFRSMA